MGHKSPLRATAAFPEIKHQSEEDKPWRHAKLEKIESLGS
jgi:hypothetical protein